MTPDQLQLIRATHDSVDDPALFGQRFYERLFEIAPAVGEMFPANMGAQSERLVAEFGFLVDEAGDLDAFVQRAHALGRRHAGYGVVAEHYEPVEHALLYAIEHSIGDRWNAGVEQAWRLLYRLAAETMLGAAADTLFSTSGGE